MNKPARPGKPRIERAPLLLLLAVILFAVYGYAYAAVRDYLGYNLPRSPFEFTKETYPHYSFPAATPVLHVFFLGNSYTFFNDLPDMIGAIAGSDSVSPVDIESEMVAKGSITLSRLWYDPEAQAKLHSRHWDYVVLQEQSMHTLNPETIQDMHESMISWNAAIRQAGSKPIVYETWARKPGSDWYDVKKYPGAGFGDPLYMQNRIDKVTNYYAAEIDAHVVPVGDFWAACRKQPGAPELYYPDGSHPSLAGDYLVALLFYRTLTAHTVDNVRYIPNGLSAADALMLKKCASLG